MSDVDLSELDDALLALLEMEGSTERARFIETAADLKPTREDKVPGDTVTADAWLDHAHKRGYIKYDPEDGDEGLVTISYDGRDRLVGLL